MRARVTSFEALAFAEEYVKLLLALSVKRGRNVAVLIEPRAALDREFFSLHGVLHRFL